MKFGKEFQTHLEETLPEWRDKFLCYKPLKKFIKNIPSSSDAPILDTGGAVGDGDVTTGSRSSVGLEEWFVRILNEELEKFNDFYENKDEEFVIRLQELKGRIEKVKEKSCKDGVLTSEIKRSEEILNIRKDYVVIHGEIILLKNYSSLNFAGLVKILKKYDKRTGEMLSLPFTKRALHQPFFTTEPLTGLIRECEANLELLCPFEPEVIESILSQRDQMDPPSYDTRADSEEAPPSLGEDTIDIYRSTLAAIRTIHSLRRKSSTYNPLSFSSFLRRQEEEDESTGAITAESSAGLQNEEGTEKGDAHSYK